MKLIIDLKYGLPFILYLRDKLQEYILGTVNENKLVQIQKYINSQYNIQFSVYGLLQEVVAEIDYYIFSNKYIIQINPNKLLLGTDAKLIDLSNLINYGILGINGYPIFSEAFKYFNENVDALYETWIKEQ